MTGKEHKEITSKLLALANPENQGEVSELLTQLTNDYDETLEQLATANDSVETLTARNEKLRAVNADLFLQVGTTNKPSGDEGTIKDDEGEETLLSYEDLFNEKGELK